MHGSAILLRHTSISQIARMRALEAGRYVVRATNNGVSAFIGPKGELLDTAPQFEYAAMTMDIIPHDRFSTPFVRSGNWPVVTLLLGILAWFSWSFPTDKTDDPSMGYPSARYGCQL